MTDKERIERFIDKYDVPIAKQIRAVRAKLRKLFPRGYELVYDNYNALAIGFSYNEKASGVVLSVVGYPRWVSVFFFNGAKLDDPDRLLKGTGSKIRHIVLQSPRDLDSMPAKKLIAQSLKQYEFSFADAPKRSTQIKMTLPKQRSRRPRR